MPDELSDAAIAAYPDARRIEVRTRYGAIGAELGAAELAWENDLNVGGRLAACHDEEVTRLLFLASARLDAVIDRELAIGAPVEVSVEVGGQWTALN